MRAPAAALPPATAGCCCSCPTPQLEPAFLCAGGFDPEDEGLLLDRKAHAKYLSGGLGALPSGG